MWNTFDVNVLVNGSRCKQYNHDGRTYIEAKDGSEWYFQIQNNSPGRVLAVCSVDGLNVLTGETAKPDDTGYIIDAYHSQKIKGFRFSDDAWALFKFGYKLNGKTYAQSKGNGAERNCGVVGVRLFYEKPPKVEYIPVPEPPYYPKPGPIKPYNPWEHPWHCNGITGSYSANVNWSAGGPDGTSCNAFPGVPTRESDQSFLCSNSLNDKQDLHAYHGNVSSRKCSTNVIKKSIVKSENFDMGTRWGKKETSKVVTIDFERGCEAYSTDIYYASRNSLIDMGVPLTNNIKINRLPESFPSRYAKPPKGWKGE